MTEREQFEKAFPAPSETVWSDHLSAYVQKNRRVLSAYDDLWQVWQAARATPPEGMAIVPVEPTLEMVDAAEQVDWSKSDTKASVINMWQAMLAAAKEGV